MAVYLSIDAGGSKCAAILYDESLRLLGKALTGGVNTTQTTPEEARANMAAALDQVLQDAKPKKIDRLYLSIIGSVPILLEEIRKRVELVDTCNMSEPVAGLYASALQKSGILALAGTGSDVFWVLDGSREFKRRTVVGSWGPILGDQGSGVWMGQRALREIVKGVEGWGEQTMMLDMIRKEWNLANDYEMVRVVHSNPAPFRKVGSLTRIIGRAATAGDAFALKVLSEAGDLMAQQTLCLIERENIPPEMRCAACCGGAWKTHIRMFDTYRARLLEKYPDMTVQKPLFEHVIAGPARILLEKGMTREEAQSVLDERFPEYIIRW